MLTIVTGCNSRYFKFLIQVVDNVIIAKRNNKFNPGCKIDIVVYNLGLTDKEANYLSKQYPDIIIEKFKFSQYPEHVSLEKYNGINCNYSWKPIIIYEVCEKYNNMVYWIDTRCLIQDLTKVLAIVSENGIYSPDTGYSSDDAIYKWTHNTTLNYMDARKYQHCRPRSGGIFLINYNIDWCKKLVTEWKNLALVKECICPDGSSRSNHRQDQSILSILYHRYKEKYGFKVINQCIGITRHNSLKDRYKTLPWHLPTYIVY